MLCPTCSRPQRADAPVRCTCTQISETQPGSPSIERQCARNAVALAAEIHHIEEMGVDLPSGSSFTLSYALDQIYGCQAVMSS